MSTELGSRTNPIRFYGEGGVGRAKKVFENQKHGMFVQEYTGYGQNPTSQMFYCTNRLTENNEPMWALMSMDQNGNSVPLPAYYILVKQSDGGKKFETQNINSEKNNLLTKSQAEAQKRNRYQILGNPDKFGDYVFIGLSKFQVEGAGSERSMSSLRSTLSTRLEPLLDIETSAAIYAAGQKRLLDAYDYVSADTNKVAGPGASVIEQYNNRVTSRIELNTTITSGSTTSTSTTSSTKNQSGTTNNGTNTKTFTNKGKTSSSPSAQSQQKSGSKKVITNTSNPIRINLSSVLYKNSSSPIATLGQDNRPYMEQRYFVYEEVMRNGEIFINRTEVIRRHVFEIIPNSFEFSQLSSTWNEVGRSGNYPLVDWSNYNLTKVSFRFLVSGTRIDTRVGESEGTIISTKLNDGLDVSVDEKIENLRAMGGAPAKIRIYNMNTLLTDSFRYPYLNKAGSIEWVIADMSITANRQTTNGTNISAAEVSITLNEYPMVSRSLAQLPALSPSSIAKPNSKKVGKAPEAVVLFTESFLFLKDNTIEQPAPNNDLPTG